MRNNIINIMNDFLFRISHQCKSFNYISTEFERKLFSRGGYRKHELFSSNGDDNVHLNSSGIVRLGKHLKYLAHSS